MESAENALVCGLKVPVGCQDRFYVNSDADETLAGILTPRRKTFPRKSFARKTFP